MRIIKISFLVFLFLTTLSCQGKPVAIANSKLLGIPLNLDHLDSYQHTEDWRSEFLKKDSTKSYADMKAEVVQIKSAIFSKDLSYDSLGALFTDLLVYGIIPYWYGTAWKFEGHTAIPNQGEIACGYFVSTTLLHVGININRYKLAQQLPIHEAASLALTDSVLVISEVATEEIIREMQRQTIDGIYFLGFDQSHVGFLLNKKNELYVIHSNYIGGSVTIERIEESLAFASYRKFYVSPLSTNKSFLKKWKKNEVIQVIETP
jgi:hypothetical protein